MSSLDSLLVRQALKKGLVRRVTNDLSVGLRLRYIGTSTVTSVAVTQADSIVLTTAAATDTFLFDGAGSYSTLGALSDAINATGRWESKVMDALRSEDPDDFFVTSAGVAATTDDNGVATYDLVIDTSAAATFGCLLSPSINWDSPTGHRVSLIEVDYLVNNTAAFDTLSITKRKGTTETVIYAATNTDNSAASLTFASGNGSITLGNDEELVVQFDGTVVDAADGYIQVIGTLE
ncbi:hypothetical protein M0R04_06720 [Candidatus Dojkabacteria bacterium]|jgi:hypothetical protein|nr:hypothetical protein [Candidatus Dojkabacteria bacterium]